MLWSKRLNLADREALTSSIGHLLSLPLFEYEPSPEFPLAHMLVDLVSTMVTLFERLQNLGDMGSYWQR